MINRMPTTSLLNRFKAWLAKLLGYRYAAVIDLFDRTIGAFALVFVGKFIGSLADWHTVVVASYWQTAGGGLILAGVAFVQGLLTILITGQPQALALVSRTVRARREYGARVRHKVALHEGKKAA